MVAVILEELELPEGAANNPPPLAAALDQNWSLADLQEHLGGIPLNRIRLYPSPGRATEQDLVSILDRKICRAELVDGILVEKPVGFFESLVEVALIHLISRFVYERKLGIVLSSSGPIRLFPEQVRLPDVCFIHWSRFPDGKLPSGQILSVTPDLAVEVISPSNTKAEMERKLADYFAAGVKLVWYVYPVTQSVRVFTSPTDFEDLLDEQILEGADVLSGFQVSVNALFELAKGQ